ncbi:MAG: error-prone DNA polymerase [Deltaproteobacteria bacterium]|nr:error-prone DNA polymerase [Deltaproteobacteria bacterium]
MSYASLWCKSGYSFLEGASHPEELVEEAHRLGIRSIAIADRDGVYGMVRAHVKACDLGMHLICGAQFTVASSGSELAASPITVGLHDHERGRGPGWGVDTDDLTSAIAVTGRRGRTKRSKPRQVAMGASPDLPATSSLVLLAMDRAGWANLTRLLTIGRRRCDKGAAIVTWPEVCARAGGLIALWGGDASMLAGDHDPDPRLLSDLRTAFGDRLYALLARHRRAADVPRELRLRERARAAGIPLVACTEVLYHSRSRRPLQDVLACIRHQVTLATAGRKIHDNDEHDLRSPHSFERLFHDEPGAVERTLEIAARCTFSLGELRYRYPSERLPSGHTSADYLRELTYTGALGRYGVASTEAIPADVRRQLDAELALIEELDYPGYFLTMHELVSYCGRRNIICQGRGSAANSAVCYCLGITAVDPVRMGFLFERFLSRERAEPPDIDLDIEHERREEVIQHVYAVYGRDHAAMVCNVVRYRPRSAVRDVGKVLGIPETALDRAAKHLSMYGLVEEDALKRAGLQDHHASSFDLLAKLSNEILELPRHISIHPGGFLLGHEPVHDIVPIENAAMPGRTVIQWDKDDLEDLGLFKVDLLALGALHQLHLAFDLLEKHRGIELSMATIPAEDSATYDMICTADTVGTFQIESRAQMSMLPRLLPRTFYDLVVEVSLVRPGPISGGMVHPYLRRRKGLEPVIYPHPCLEPVLAKTLGVPLFQEQVMRLAVVAADYTPGEADQLRRDMAAWRRSGRIEKHRERLISRMEAKGIDRTFGERVFEQIRGFGEYGFPECVVGSTRVIDADTGKWVAIEDVVTGRHPLRTTLTCNSDRVIEPRHVIAARASGRKKVFRMRTISGCEIEATASHPFLAETGWVQLGDLRAGDRVTITFPGAHARVTSWDEIHSIEPRGEQDTYDLEIEGNHNFVANDFVVHNSHAASFALIAYATSWMRKHYLAEFTCSLLDAQPMGFYSAATIVGDAQRHGLEIRPIDVTCSEWDCTLEPISEGAGVEYGFAVRMGLRWTRGLQLSEGQRIVTARRERQFGNVEELVRRTGISGRAHTQLAEAGALGGLTEQRRDALWQVRGWIARQHDEVAFGSDADDVAFAKLSKLDEIFWDYAASDHSTRGHPLQPLRAELRANRWPDARSISRGRDGQHVEYVGVVICRQQPGTASGVVFMTLEDETGFVNLVVWPQVFADYGHVIRTTSVLGVTGKLQVQEGFVHVIADRVWVPKLSRPVIEVASRDFH